MARTDSRLKGDSLELGTLADSALHNKALALPSSDREWLHSALRGMLLIRAAEECIGDMVTAGKVHCPCHLSIGQEAVAVGVARPLRAGERGFGAHRSHSHYLALGGSVRRLLAEVLGKNTGSSKGMGGSMHLIDLANGLMGTVPIVGATIPIATGAALAAKMDGRGDVAVSFFGDGATEEGVFHESLNLAATMQLPVMYVCENNFFSSHLHISLRQPRDSIARYAVAHDIPVWRLDGNDVIAVASAADEAVELMRAGGGPTFIEAVTYRWRGHVGPREDEDVGVRRKDDLRQWRTRDPIRRLHDALKASGDAEESLLEILELEVRAEVDAAWTLAEADPFPTPESLLSRVYGSSRL
jgi:TPP-dependent pyruvate/acetoin dehydrogenase alpha subunit